MLTMESLGAGAAEVAMRAAVEYLCEHKLTADPEALVECLRSWIKIKLPEALRDAKDALDCGPGMRMIAERTFNASMALAGIEAAKEACNPPG